jgi:hypothetical protein
VITRWRRISRDRFARMVNAGSPADLATVVRPDLR